MARGNHLYDNFAFIGDDNSGHGVHFHWRITDNSELNIAVAAKATGWVGFGIAESGGMPGADIAIYTAIDDKLTDTHAVAYAKPNPDECQDWELIHSVVGESEIIFEAKRPLDTGDNQNRVLVDDSHVETPAHRVIAAWGDTNTYEYHGSNRARGSVRFFIDESERVSDNDEDGYEDLLIRNFRIPTQQTTYEYFCFELAYKRVNGQLLRDVTAQITKISFLQDPDTEGLVHHTLLYGKNVMQNNISHII